MSASTFIQQPLNEDIEMVPACKKLKLYQEHKIQQIKYMLVVIQFKPFLATL